MKIEKSPAINILLGLLTIVILLHLLILLKIVPYAIAWGGRLQTDAQMYFFESLSIITNFVLVVVLLIKGKYIRVVVGDKTLNCVLWIYAGLFILNTVGNLAAQTMFERLFAIVTLIFAFLIRAILRSK